MAGGVDPLQAPLPLTRGLMRVLGAIVQIAMLAVLHPSQNLLLCGTIALELGRDDHPRDILATLEQLAGEFLGRVLVAPALYKNIQDVPSLIHRPPQIITLTVECERDFIQVPLVTWPGASMAELIGIFLAKLAAPLPDRLVGHRDAAGKQELFHVPITEAETEIQPDRVPDNLGREAVVLTAVGGLWCVHTTRMSHAAAAEQVDNASTIPMAVAVQIPDAVAKVEARERPLIEACRAPEFTVEKLKEVWQQVRGYA
jgi:hypothetical protein